MLAERMDGQMPVTKCDKIGGSYQWRSGGLTSAKLQGGRTLRPVESQRRVRNRGEAPLATGQGLPRTVHTGAGSFSKGLSWAPRAVGRHPSPPPALCQRHPQL